MKRSKRDAALNALIDRGSHASMAAVALIGAQDGRQATAHELADIAYAAGVHVGISIAVTDIAGARRLRHEMVATDVVTDELTAALVADWLAVVE